MQRCKDLANDKVRFSERRTNDTCFANVSKCVDSSSGDTDEIKEQRRQCIMKAKQQRDKEFADLPSPEDCEAASKGTQSGNGAADNEIEAKNSQKKKQLLRQGQSIPEVSASRKQPGKVIKGRNAFISCRPYSEFPFSSCRAASPPSAKGHCSMHHLRETRTRQI